MENHGLEVKPPEFRFTVIAVYLDALRCQISEGLYVLDSGTLNRKTKFYQNVICRLVVPEKYQDSDWWIKRELDNRNTLKSKMRNFIQVMSHVTNCFVKKNRKDPSQENNSFNTFRYPTDQQRMEAAGNRKRQAVTSTPASDHRMVTLI